MSKADHEGLLKITDRAIQLLVCWKKLFLSAGQDRKYPLLVPRIDSAIAELAEYRFDLKRVLKGQSDLGANEKLRFLLEEIEKTEDPGTHDLYIEKLLCFTKKILNEGLLEAMDGQS